MKFIQNFILVTLFSLSFTLMYADCTVTTPCGSNTYNVDNISVSTSQSNGITTITVFSNGQQIDTITCASNGGVSVNCTGQPGQPGQPGGNQGDFCSAIASLPSWIRALLGCN